MSECKHKRIKRNYPFGRKSEPRRICKDCGQIITGKMLKNKSRGKRK
ncbi:MAG: hypothetical protein ACOC1X_02465 [Promethearchaeota archaeon]